jgi:CHAD domain-containing protein
MTTADRTPIRRRLAIGRRPHRPPWGARKAGHGLIVAPFAATVAATLAVGVGVGLGLARSERERRRARQLELERRLGLAPGEPVGRGLRRMALAQVDLALELLGAEHEHQHVRDGTKPPRAPDERAVHDTRKAIKRLRALLALLEDELGQRAYAREDDTLRDVAQRLSGARDAAVMLATLDGLLERHPRKLARRGGARKLRARLQAEHRRAEQLALNDPLVRAEVLGELHALRYRVAAWTLPERPGMQLVEPSFQRIYRQGRTRRARAVRAKRAKRTLAMHRWRKRVKDLRYAAEMLDRRDSPDRREGSRGASSRGRTATPVRKLARRADGLGELLGEEHDLAVFAERLRAGARGKRRSRSASVARARGESPRTWRTGRRTRRTLLSLIAKRRRKLRRQALRQGQRLYRERPGKLKLS